MAGEPFMKVDSEPNPFMDLSNQDNLQGAGDIRVLSVNVKSAAKGEEFTVTHQVMAIEIYEDLFAPFISGNIILRDSQEFSSLLPLMGEETISLNLKTPKGIEYKKIFAIYKMGERIQVSKDDVAFMLYFMSLEGIIDQNRKISRCFQGEIAKKEGSCIVRTIVESIEGLDNQKGRTPDHFYKELFIEGFDDAVDSNTRSSSASAPFCKYISNFWSPVQNLNYLAERANTALNSPTYIFFENRKGFHFVTMSALYENKYGESTEPEFIYEKALPENAGITPEQDYKRIISFNTHQTFDYMKRLQGGMYGSEIISFDIVTKQYAHVGYKSDFKAYPHLNAGANVNQDVQTTKPPAHHRSNIMILPKFYNNFDDATDTTSFQHIQNRLSLMSSAEAFKLQIIVNGKLDYYVGQRVKVSFPIFTQQTESLQADFNNLEDKVYSGKYLISALCHKIDRTKHTCIMEVIKDSYMTDMTGTFYDPGS